MSNIILVIVNILDVQSFLKKLNRKDKLSKVREVLSCDDKFLFLKSIDGSTVEDEENFLLEEILSTDVWDNQTIYLKKLTYWEILNKEHKLDYGRTISSDGTKTANKRAFILKDFDELKEIDEYGQGTIEINSNEDLLKNRNLFFDTDISINGFINLGLSYEKTCKKIINDGKKLVYNYTKVGKASLKLNKDNLEPTPEFIKVIKDTIKCGIINLKEITKDYGLFIPTEIIMGGRFYTNETEIFSGHNEENTVNIDVRAGIASLSRQFGRGRGKSKNITKFRKVNHMKSLGGNCNGVFDENKWTESLRDHRNWDCIEFNNPISIFQLLPYDLRKELFLAAGKKILFTGTLKCGYYLNRPGNYRKFELIRSNIPKNILNIIQNEEADCDFLAAAIDINYDSKNDFFACHILKERIGGKKINPSIIIHAIQKEFQPRIYELNIFLMVIGYDIDFNFIIDNHVEIIKKQYDPRNEKFDSIILQTKSELDGTNFPFFGISILNSLEDSNVSSLVIGHNFHNVQSNNELKIDLFSYCSKDNCYFNLPNFTFCVLIILNPNAYKSFHFTFKILKKPFINLDSQPEYVSFLHLLNNYQPIFLNQKIKRINIEYSIIHKKRKYFYGITLVNTCYNRYTPF
ncbi:hypothetical protein GLOIN_2v1549518 [Rhizophagus clarus]|uniref:DUF7431 domain-containing protein n=1 Tax=Rhizophagus clarus TaxID=94130 RepID=A0A8H3KRB8_9GLOM|nr:hypothetical protein GLOIN_2v1549518 [Rhizophagus clarus]